MTKMTLKDLSLEVENLKQINTEKDNLIRTLDEKMSGLQKWAQEMYSTLCGKISETDQRHCNNENILDNKIKVLEEKVQGLVGKQAEKETNEPVVRNLSPKVQCNECSLNFDKLKILKKHIEAVHPKVINCNQCDLTFDKTWKLEQHFKVHSSEKRFKCDKCDKTFLLQWRLRKHLQGHEQQNVKFCHFYNNNKICNFEEVSGCMFRHAKAPLCKFSDKCKFTKCQFSHTFNDDDNESEYDSDGDGDCVDNGTENPENLDKVDNSPTTPAWRCEYGLCDFRQIIFNNKESLKVHLENEHGINGN